MSRAGTSATARPQAACQDRATTKHIGGGTQAPALDGQAQCDYCRALSLSGQWSQRSYSQLTICYAPLRLSIYERHIDCANMVRIPRALREEKEPAMARLNIRETKGPSRQAGIHLFAVGKRHLALSITIVLGARSLLAVAAENVNRASARPPRDGR
jgi:hypothetical protein